MTDIKGELKEYLKNTGRDIAKAVGEHVKKKGIEYVTTQLGMGMEHEMYGKAIEMKGDGKSKKDWFKKAGIAVAKHVGNHLKEHFKDMAITKAKEYLGEGLKDELKKTAKAIGKDTFEHAKSQIGTIKDKKSAKKAAVSTGKAAIDAGKKHFTKLISDHFGGAMTPEQGVKTCMFKIDELRRAITQMRKAELHNKTTQEYLHMHVNQVYMADEKREGKAEADKKRAKFKADIPTMTERQRLRQKKAIKAFLHPAVSTMKRIQLVEYIYGTSIELHIDWSKYLKVTDAVRKRESKACEQAGPNITGQKVSNKYEGEEEFKVSKQTKQKLKKAPSEYNKFMAKMLADKNFEKGKPHKERFKAAAAAYKDAKAMQNDLDGIEVVDDEVSINRGKKRKNTEGEGIKGAAQLAYAVGKYALGSKKSKKKTRDGLAKAAKSSVGLK